MNRFKNIINLTAIFVFIAILIQLTSCKDDSIEKIENGEVISSSELDEVFDLPEDVTEIEMLQDPDQSELNLLSFGSGDVKEDITALGDKKEGKWEILSATTNSDLNGTRCYICSNLKAKEELVKILEDRDFTEIKGDTRAGNWAANCEITKVSAEIEALKKQAQDLEKEIKDLQQEIKNIKNNQNKQKAEVNKATENRLNLKLKDYENKIRANLEEQKVNLNKKVLSAWKNKKISASFAWQFIQYVYNTSISSRKEESNEDDINDEVVMISASVDCCNVENINIIAKECMSSLDNLSIIMTDTDKNFFINEMQSADKVRVIS